MNTIAAFGNVLFGKKLSSPSLPVSNEENLLPWTFRRSSEFAVTLFASGFACFLATKVGLDGAAQDQGGLIMWPSSGLSLALLVVCGPRVWPALFCGALIAYVAAGVTWPSSAIAATGAILEAAVTRHLIARYSSDDHIFSTPSGVGRFVVISFAGTTVGALIAGIAGAGLSFNEDPLLGRFAAGWIGWWISDFLGVLVVAPFVILWATDHRHIHDLKDLIRSGALFASAGALSFVAFGPLFPDLPHRPSIAFLVVLPLMWAALRSPRDTATVILITAAMLAWGTLAPGSWVQEMARDPSSVLIVSLVLIITIPPLAVSAFVDLLSEQKRSTEAGLSQAHHQLLQLERGTHSGTWAWELSTGRFISSAQLPRIFGVASGSMGDTLESFLSHVHEGDRVRVAEQLDRVVRVGQPMEIEMRVTHSGGEVRWIRSSGEVQRNSRGDPVRLIGCSQEVTYLRRVERERKDTAQAYTALVERVRDYATRNLNERREVHTALLETREQLAQSQKMEAIGQLTGGVAHDFNNLLTIVMGNLELAESSLENLSAAGRDRLRRVLSNAMRGAQKGAALTQRLLAFSRRQPLEPKILDVNRLLGDASDFLRRSLGERVTLDIRASGALWPVEADPVQLESAILNLAVNARDAMPNGGKLTIETSNVLLTEQDRQKDSEIVGGEYVEIAVRDTGEGMSAETIRRAFEPFYTTKEVGQGTGLGLSQVYGYVKQSGGHVCIQSVLGRGTAISIYLPRMPGELPQDDRDADTTTSRREADTILVVEDDHDVRSYVVEILREMNYRVFEAHDSESALRLVDRKDLKLDLLLTDVVLPGMNGLQLSEEVKAIQPHIVVLLMTGYASQPVALNGRIDAGGQVIQKPFTREELATRVQKLLDRGQLDFGRSVQLLRASAKMISENLGK